MIYLATLLLSDFQKIIEGVQKKPKLDGVEVLIERMPECKSIYVSEFSALTSREEVETYFGNEVGELDPVRGVVFNPRWDEDEKYKRAIVYFKGKKSE